MIYFIYLSEQEELEKWNNGICVYNNKPWEYTTTDYLSDGSSITSFKSGKYSMCISTINVEKCLETYKGKKEWK